jgi:hypothetical protein
MGIPHKIKTKNNGIKKVDLTPLKAIRTHCLECVGWISSEVSLCPGVNCALFPYRAGTNPGRTGRGSVKNIQK